MDWLNTVIDYRAFTSCSAGIPTCHPSHPMVTEMFSKVIKPVLPRTDESVPPGWYEKVSLQFPGFQRVLSFGSAYHPIQLAKTLRITATDLFVEIWSSKSRLGMFHVDLMDGITNTWETIAIVLFSYVSNT